MDKKQLTSRLTKFIIVLIASILLMVAFTQAFGNTQTKLSYSKFMEKVNANKIEKVMINLSDSTFVAVGKNEKMYTVDNPKYDNFKKDLLEKGVEVTEEHATSYVNLMFNVLQLAIMIVIGFAFYNLMKQQVGSSVSDVSAEDKNGTRVKTTFKDIAGLKQVKSDMELLIDFLKEPEKFNEAGAKMPKGVILTGPPGTGKTLLAKAIAGEANVPFFSVSGSDFIEMFVGVGAKRVRELFKSAEKVAPCIIFIDEIDAIGGSREAQASGNTEQRQTINALLSAMDGFSGREGILVIAATNRIDDLDPALIRPGRFDKQITVPLPDTPSERLEVINLYKNNKKFSDDVDFNLLSKETIGFSPADIEALLNEAALISVQKKLPYINRKCIDDAIYKKLLRGHAKRDAVRDDEELKLVAWHEAGHATIAKLCDMDVSKVTIVKSTSGAGGVNIIVPKKMGLYSIDELSNQVRMCYGGRCGEMMLYGDKTKITTGASADIKQATGVIHEMITTYGMTDTYGMLNLTDLHIDNRTILEEAMKMSKRFEHETMEMLEEYKDMHQEIVKCLLEKETIDGDELDEIYKKYRKDIIVEFETEV